MGARKDSEGLGRGGERLAGICACEGKGSKKAAKTPGEREMCARGYASAKRGGLGR